MYCQQCGRELEASAVFCSECGAKAADFQDNAAAPAEIVIAPAETAESSAESAEAAEKSPVKAGFLLRIAALALVVLLTGVFILLRCNAKGKCFEAALELSEKGLYAEAQEAFSSLGGYKDSGEQAELAGAMVKFEEGKQLLSEGKTEEALEIFTSLGSLADSEAKECSDEISYEKAGLLFSTGNYRTAGDIFTELGSFRNSPELAEQCYTYADFEDANALMADGSYQEALELFESIDAGAVTGLEDKTQLCRKYLTYAEADKALAEGKNYEAFKKFLSVAEIEDAACRAQQCTVDYPESGELYHNPEPARESASFSVKSKTDTAAVYRLYLEDGTLVSTLFVNPGETAEVSVPAGKYYINRGFGEAWFGPEDFFGDEGRYLKFEQDDETIFTFDAGSSNVLTEYSYGHEYGTPSLTRDSF